MISIYAEAFMSHLWLLPLIFIGVLAVHFGAWWLLKKIKGSNQDF